MDEGSPLFTPEDPYLKLSDGAERPAKRARAKRGLEDEEERLAKCSRSVVRTESNLVVLAGAPVTGSAEKYRKIKKVGVGAYGSVFMAENEETKEIVAIKVSARKEDPLLGGFPVSLLREIAILKRVRRHESIVRLHEVAQTTSGAPVLVMEFCQASLLELLLSPKHDLSFSEVKYIVRQILSATNHLHSHGVLHRDLATKNILFNLSGEIKVCDFGISRMAFGWDDEFGELSAPDLESPNMIVSLPYRAIELLLGESNYGPALDVWAVGCILAEVLLCQAGRRQTVFGGDPGNPNKTQLAVVEEIFHILGRPTEETWPGLSRLPLLRNLSSARTGSATPQKARGEERAFMKRHFVSGEGRCSHEKFRLTESCFDLLGGLFSLCPRFRFNAKEGLAHTWFTEKPLPEWHAWHWKTLGSDIPRGDDMRRERAEVDTLLRQLSGDTKSRDDAATKQGASLRDSVKDQLERRRRDAERQAEKAAQKVDKHGGRAQQQLPAGWTAQWSSSKQRYYYHDSKTGKNSWQPPRKPGT